MRFLRGLNPTSVHFMIMMAFFILMESRTLVVLESLSAWALEGTVAPCRYEMDARMDIHVLISSFYNSLM